MSQHVQAMRDIAKLQGSVKKKIATREERKEAVDKLTTSSRDVLKEYGLVIWERQAGTIPKEENAVTRVRKAREELSRGDADLDEINNL